MTHPHARLEALFDKVRGLPEDRQERIVEALEEIAASEPYQLSDEELGVLLPELAGALRGEFASDAAVDAVLNTPWSKARASQ